MDPELMQTDMSPEDAAASLAFGTNLMDQSLASQENPEEQAENEPMEEEKPLRDQYPQEEENTELDVVREEIKALREEIQEVLSEEDQKEEHEEPEAPKPTQEA